MAAVADMRQLIVVNKLQYTSLRQKRIGINYQAGFTLFEAVVALVIVALLSATLFATLINPKLFQLQSNRDDVLQTFLYAQLLALSRTEQVCVVLAADQVDVQLDVDEDGNCEDDESYTLGPISYPFEFDQSVTLTASQLEYQYDRLGQTDAGTITMSVSDASATITLTTSGHAYVGS